MLQAEGDEEEEPMWIEVAVDLILSLLSQSSCIPKNMLDIFFFHLCPHLTGAALGQITKVCTHVNELQAFDLLTVRIRTVCQ